MIIIYEYKNDPNLMWNDQQTYLCVYDKNNIQVADYDFDTGLNLMLSGDTISVFMEESDLVSGKWTFFGVLSTAENGTIVSREEIEISGKGGKAKLRTYNDQNPWRFDHRPGTYVSVEEREERISICRSCPMFDRKGFCKINDMLAIERTKMKIGFCPEGKWGSEEEAIELYKTEFVGENTIKYVTDGQAEFEAELDEFLKGL